MTPQKLAGLALATIGGYLFVTKEEMKLPGSVKLVGEKASEKKEPKTAKKEVAPEGE